MTMFDRPAPPGDQFDCSTHVGALLVIDVLEKIPPMTTKASKEPIPAIRVDLYVITPQGTVAEEYRNALLFQRMLVSRLSQSVGRKVLGVLTGQPGVSRDGKNVPYDLDDPNDAMEAAAVRAMMAHAPAAQVADPWATQQAPPGWGAAAPQPQPGPWQAAPPQQGAPNGWGQQPATAPQQAPPGWGQASPQQPPQAPPWGQQQLPQPPAQADPYANVPPPERPPWETEQQPATAPPWGQQ